MKDNCQKRKIFVIIKPLMTSPSKQPAKQNLQLNCQEEKQMVFKFYTVLLNNDALEHMIVRPSDMLFLLSKTENGCYMPRTFFIINPGAE